MDSFNGRRTFVTNFSGHSSSFWTLLQGLLYQIGFFTIGLPYTCIRANVVHICFVSLSREPSLDPLDVCVPYCAMLSPCRSSICQPLSSVLCALFVSNPRRHLRVFFSCVLTRQLIASVPAPCVLTNGPLLPVRTSFFFSGSQQVCCRRSGLRRSEPSFSHTLFAPGCPVFRVSRPLSAQYTFGRYCFCTHTMFPPSPSVFFLRVTAFPTPVAILPHTPTTEVNSPHRTPVFADKYPPRTGFTPTDQSPPFSLFP